MLQTIPLKRKNKTVNTHHASRVHQSLSNNHKNRRGVFTNPWIALLIIVAIAVLGIAIIRYSRASSGGLGIPKNIASIQSYLNSLQIPSTESKTINGYAQFTYTPKTNQPVAVVAYYIDGLLIDTSTKLPYQVTVNTNYLLNGPHQLSVVAFNNADVPVAAKTQTINIQNQATLIQSAKNVITYPWYWLLNL